jgi:hypothetical protein
MHTQCSSSELVGYVCCQNAGSNDYGGVSLLIWYLCLGKELSRAFREIHVEAAGLEDCNITCVNVLHDRMCSEYGMCLRS